MDILKALETLGPDDQVLLMKLLGDESSIMEEILAVFTKDVEG